MGIKVHTVKQQKDLIASFRYSGKGSMFFLQVKLEGASATNTTVDALFAEALLHSAKALPSATLGKEQTAKPHPAKGSNHPT